MKKVLCLLLALVLTLCFTGCEVQLGSSVIENPDTIIENDNDQDEDSNEDENSSEEESSNKNSSDKNSSNKNSSDKNSSNKNSSNKNSSNKESSNKTSSNTSSKDDPFNAVGSVLGGDTQKAEIWDGTVAKKIARGNGEKDTPYLITSPDEFAYALSTVAGRGYYFQLSCDIYLNDVSSPDWMLNKDNNPWFTDKAFNGHLDGNGYCVYGVWIDPTEPPSRAGLVSAFTGGSITNLGLRYAFIIGKDEVGGFAGRAMQGEYREIKNCFADETVYVKAESATGVAGIVGYAYCFGDNVASLLIENCYSKAQLYNGNTESHRRVNGIVGCSYDTAYLMKNCLSVNASPYYGPYKRWISDMVTKGGLKASEAYKNVYGTEGSATQSESWTTVSVSSIKGDGAKSKLKGFDFDNVWETVDGSTPKLRIFKGIDGKEVSVKPLSEISLDSFKKPAGKPAK